MTFAAGSDDVHTSRALYIAFCSHTMHVMPASAIIPAPVPSAPPTAVLRCSNSDASSWDMLARKRNYDYTADEIIGKNSENRSPFFLTRLKVPSHLPACNAAAIISFGLPAAMFSLFFTTHQFALPMTSSGA